MRYLILALLLIGCTSTTMPNEKLIRHEASLWLIAKNQSNDVMFVCQEDGDGLDDIVAVLPPKSEKSLVLKTFGDRFRITTLRAEQYVHASANPYGDAATVVSVTQR